MAFNLEHWDNPRETIATVYKNNDMAYATHGILCAYEILKILDKKPSELKNKTCLDYGCGTGKNTRAIQYFFANSVGYDPVDSCIVYAHREFNTIIKHEPAFPDKLNLLDPATLQFTSKLKDIINTEYDVTFAHNVIEHLSHDEQMEAVNNMLKMTREGGTVIFNTFIERSIELIKYYEAKNSLEVDFNFGYYTILKK